MARAAVALVGAVASAGAMTDVAARFGVPCAAIVSSSGSASRQGAAPPAFTSITAAQMGLRSGAVPRSPNGATFVCIGPGQFFEALTLTSADSGADVEHPVVYLGVAGESVLTGAVPVTLSPARTIAAGVIMSANASAAALAAGFDVDWAAASAFVSRGFQGGCQPAPPQLVVGDTRATLARWPNIDDGSAGTTPGFALTRWPAVAGTQNVSFWVNASTAPFLSYADTATMLVHGWWYYEWADEWYQFAGVNTTVAGRAQVLVDLAHAPAPMGGEFLGGARYYVANSVDALDAVGEYYFNASSGVVSYVAPPGTQGPLAAALTANSTLITLTGVANVAFVNLTVMGARGYGVSGSQCSGIAVINCTFTALGGSALTMGQSNDTFIGGNTMRDLGCGGARMWSGGVRTCDAIVPSGTLIVDNVIAGFERDVFTYQQGVALDSGGVAAHNDISDAPHSGVTLDGNDVLVMANVIHEVSGRTFDNAAIYFYPTDWSKRNASIVYNVLYGNGEEPATCNTATSCNRDAVYPDNGNAGVNVVGNVIYHSSANASAFDLTCDDCSPLDRFVRYALFNDGGRDMTATNNILILDGANASFNGGAGITWDAAQQGNGSTYIAELQAVRWDTGLWAAKYPRLATLHDWWPAGGAQACAADPDCGGAPFGNAITTNLIVNVSTLMTYPPASSGFDDAAFNLSNNVVNAGDPGFVDPDCRTSHNFALRNDSVAYTGMVGFAPLPLQCVGPWAPRCPGEPDWWAHWRGVLGG